MSVFRINKSPGEERSDKGLRDKLNAHSVTPPSYIWDNVEENLPQKRKRRGFIFWLMPLAACIAGLAGLLYILLPENTSQLAQQKTENSISSQAEKNTIQNNNNTIGDNTISKSTSPQGNVENDTELKLDSDHTSNFYKSTKKEKYTNSYYAENKNTTNNNTAKKSNLIVNNVAESVNENQVNHGKSNISDSHNKLTINELETDNKVVATDSVALKDSTLLASEKPAETKTELPKPEIKTTPETKTNNSKWAIGADIGLGYSYRLISRTNADNIYAASVDTPYSGRESAFQDYNLVESPGFSWGSGLKIRYKINNRWSLISGLNFTRLNIRSQFNTEIQVKENEPITNTERDTTYVQKNSTGEFTYGEKDVFVRGLGLLSTTSVQQQANVKYSFNYLDVPLEVQYRTSAKKVAWYIQGGPSFRFLTGKKATFNVNSNQAEVKLSQPYHTFAVSANLSSGISVPVKNFDIQFGPSFSMWLTPLMKSGPKTHLYTAHLKSAIYYNF